ncbi:hypothetical protein SAMN02910384_02165 [Pseudobutyrivibrio sp. ACV-2]|uniref:hypothetical protein n=1 Tax=Pseudobutyrivibrio sp. ACV-2 TaxID=1520801 RepID=UPI00089B9B0C|nr:hypothetical protein [Pseudobutyrivibrio sp. ACV-2]SEA72305.1 hypothetical protein SAMN02910384_02165 [Pseudobutyrivibrio sp. ACV-2]
MEPIVIREVGTLDKTQVPVEKIIKNAGILWPWYIFIGLYKICKTVVKNLKWLAIPSALLTVVIINIVVPQRWSVIPTLLDLLNIFNKYKWIELLETLGNMKIDGMSQYELVATSIGLVLLTLIINITPAYFVAEWIYHFGRLLSENIGWEYFDTKICLIKVSMLNKRETTSTELIKDIVLSLICIAILVLAMVFIPAGIKYLLHMLSVITGYGL